MRKRGKGRGVPHCPPSLLGLSCLQGCWPQLCFGPCFELAAVGNAGGLAECLRMRCFHAGVSIYLCRGVFGGSHSVMSSFQHSSKLTMSHFAPPARGPGGRGDSPPGWGGCSGDAAQPLCRVGNTVIFMPPPHPPVSRLRVAVSCWDISFVTLAVGNKRGVSVGALWGCKPGGKRRQKSPWVLGVCLEGGSRALGARGCRMLIPSWWFPSCQAGTGLICGETEAQSCSPSQVPLSRGVVGMLTRTQYIPSHSVGMSCQDTTAALT